VLKLIPIPALVATANVTMSVLVVVPLPPGKAPVFQLVVVSHALLVVPVHVASAAFKTSNLPEKMKSKARSRIELDVPPKRVKG
jgi:hypothetical protein